MNNQRGLKIGAVLILAFLVLTAGTVIIAAVFFGPTRGTVRFLAPLRGYGSNGEQIYWTGTSQAGPPITARMQGMPGMSNARLACVNCHGENGEGGPVPMMMMGTYEAPNIQYQELTAGDHDDAHAEHMPYTDETIKQAVTQGIRPGGEPLDLVMPRWNMTDEQLEDLIDYLKTLK